MESRIPVPTGNIFKFYALFGLLLFVFAIGASLYNTRATNDFLVSASVERAALSELPTPNAAEKARRAVLNRRIEVAIENKKFFGWAIAVVGAIGASMAFLGFEAWHRKIQPVQDAILDLQLRKLKKEVELLEQKACATRPTVE